MTKPLKSKSDWVKFGVFSLLIFVVLPITFLIWFWRDRCQVSLLETWQNPFNAEIQVSTYLHTCGNRLPPATELKLKVPGQDEELSLTLVKSNFDLKPRWLDQSTIEIELPKPEKDFVVTQKHRQQSYIKVLIK